MKILKFTRAKLSGLIFLTAWMSMLMPVQAQTSENFVIDEIIAKVDDHIVLKSDLEKAYLDFLNRGEYAQGNMKCRIFESLVINKMLLAKAEIDSVMVDETQVENTLDQRMDVMIARLGGDRRKIEEYYGKSIEEFKEELRDDIRDQLIQNKMQQTITEGITVTPSEVRRFFNRIPKDSLPYFSREVIVGQIVKFPEVSPSEKEKVRQQLIEIREKILSGEATFADMARKFSEDPGSAQRGGEYDFVERGTFVPEYEKAAFSMKPGDITMPIETEFGYHIIKLHERRGNMFKSSHILISPKSTSNDIVEARNYLDSLREMILLDSIAFEVAAKEYSDDEMTSGTGGFFVNAMNDTKVTADELDPLVFFALDTMEIGSISKAIEFRTEQGKQAARILYFKNRVPPHQANLKQDYQKIYAATLNQKKGRIMEEWFEEARQDVFIEIDDNYQYCNILQ